MAYKPQVLAVADGGTGLATLTAHAIQLGNGTSSPTQLAVGATSTVLAGSTGADPAFTATPTVTSITFGAGSALSTYTTATWTPNIQINSSSAGITYTTQLGGWTQIGNVVHFYVNVLLSSKGASVGGVSISNFPFTFTATGQSQSVTVCDFDGVTDATFTTLAITPINGTTVGSFVLSTASSGTAVTTLTNTMITNTTRFRFTGIFLLN